MRFILFMIIDDNPNNSGGILSQQDSRHAGNILPFLQESLYSFDRFIGYLPGFPCSTFDTVAVLSPSSCAISEIFTRLSSIWYLSAIGIADRIPCMPQNQLPLHLVFQSYPMHGDGRFYLPPHCALLQECEAWMPA